MIKPRIAVTPRVIVFVCTGGSCRRAMDEHLLFTAPAAASERDIFLDACDRDL